MENNREYICKTNRMIRWDITKGCNLSCKHCITSHMYDETKELSNDEKLKLIDKLSDDGITRIHLLGGEPTTVKNIQDIIAYATKKGIYVSMNTNGVEMSRNLDMCKCFAENNVGVSFSIDGPTADIHDITRGNGSFDKVVLAARNYKKYAEDKTVVAFYITLTPDNKNSNFSNLFELADEIGVNNIVLGVLIPMGAGKKNYNGEVLSMEEIIGTAEKFINLNKKYKKIKVSFPFQTPLLLQYFNEKIGTNFGLCYSKCRAAVQEYAMQPDGTIYPCIYLNKAKSAYGCTESELKQKNNLCKNKLDDILENKFYSTVINKLNDESLYGKIEPCNKCPYNLELDICRPCSFQDVDEAQNNIDFHRNKICKYILEQNHNNFYR
ncbi:MAG: radical SAM protein [Clostridiaceae bacterium]|nr:radical SAM protein [Clostridiaceae bacterium]